MSLKKTNANQLSHDDIVRVLDLEEENLSADICSKLRQNRYKAIDHAGIIDKRDYAREAIGWAVATAASVAIVVFLVNHQTAIDKTVIAGSSANNEQSTTQAADADRVSTKIKRDSEMKGSAAESNINDENNQKEEIEDLEIYEWLYNNYG